MTHTKGNYNKINSSLLIRNNGGQKTVGWHNQRANRKKILLIKIPYLAKLSFKNGRFFKKTFSDKQRLREFVASILLYNKH